MARSTAQRLQDMRDAIRRMQRYTSGHSAESFSADELVLDATVRNLEVLGEAAKHIPERLRAFYTDAPWARIVALRNVVVHDYAGVDPRLVWDTVQQRLPALDAALARMQQDLGPDT